MVGRRACGANSEGEDRGLPGANSAVFWWDVAIEHGPSSSYVRGSRRMGEVIVLQGGERGRVIVVKGGADHFPGPVKPAA